MASPVQFLCSLQHPVSSVSIHCILLLSPHSTKSFLFLIPTGLPESLSVYFTGKHFISLSLERKRRRRRIVSSVPFIFSPSSYTLSFYLLTPFHAKSSLSSPPRSSSVSSCPLHLCLWLKYLSLLSSISSPSLLLPPLLFFLPRSSLFSAIISVFFILNSFRSSLTSVSPPFLFPPSSALPPFDFSHLLSSLDLFFLSGFLSMLSIDIHSLSHFRWLPPLIFLSPLFPPRSCNLSPVFLFFTPQLLFIGISPQSLLPLLHLSLWDWSRPAGSSDPFWFSLLALWTSTWLDQVSSVHCVFDEAPLHSHSISPIVAVGEMRVYGCSEASPKCFHFSVGLMAHTHTHTHTHKSLMLLYSVHPAAVLTIYFST